MNIRCILSWLFAKWYRPLVLFIAIVVIWATLNPKTSSKLFTTLGYNFWYVFGPLIEGLIKLAIAGIVCWHFLLKPLFPKKAPEGGKKKKSR